MRKVLSIAGSDPSSGAGIQSDLKTFQALHIFGMALPAALTIQNSRGVFGVNSIAPDILLKQLDALLADIKPDAVKTGMLFTKQNIEVVATAIKKFSIKGLVVDPVLKSSSGKPLLQPSAITSLIGKLFPLAMIVTPNIPEAEALAGMVITSEGDRDYAAGRILDTGPAYVLIKGGHRIGPAVDTLYGGKFVLSFSTSRKRGKFHGTGCVLSSAIAVFIARGLTVEKAVEKAKQFVDKMLKTAEPLGRSKMKYFQF
jgi:hydroxymethylpyrimidine kinase/phosphomethylpyrimidine kinase